MTPARQVPQGKGVAMRGMLAGLWLVPFAFLFVAAGIVLWIWALVDCLMNEPAEGNDRIVWVLVIILTHFIGVLIYVIVRRPRRIRLRGK